MTQWRQLHHLFNSCPSIHIIWRMIHFTYNIPLHANIINIFGKFLNGLDKNTKARIRIGISAVCRVLVTGQYIWLPDGNWESRGPTGNRDNEQKKSSFFKFKRCNLKK
jgi:hypothetical protein